MSTVIVKDADIETLGMKLGPDLFEGAVLTLEWDEEQARVALQTLIECGKTDLANGIARKVFGKAAKEVIGTDMVACWDCEKEIPREDASFCSGCGDPMCGECTFECKSCDVLVCSDCGAECNDCDNRFCSGCRDDSESHGCAAE